MAWQGKGLGELGKSRMICQTNTIVTLPGLIDSPNFPAIWHGIVI